MGLNYKLHVEKTAVLLKYIFTYNLYIVIFKQQLERTNKYILLLIFITNLFP